MFNYILQLLIDTSFSWTRMFIALGLSILLGLGIGIWAATSRIAEKVRDTLGLVP
jgi:ABC-type nitrate/sulfonate/bicarbonate transport system permease component